jgi:peptide/nickel transport system substrate-binding protein
MKRLLVLGGLLAVLAVALAACGEEAEPVVIEVIKEVVVEKEVVKEVMVPGETIVVEKEVMVPGETIEVVKEVMVPGETIVVEKEVIRTVEVPKEIVREVIKVVEVERPAIRQFGEAPQLAQLVAAGKLPPVAERLPKNPMVIPTLGEIGKYGGIIRRGYTSSHLSCNFGKPARAGLLRFSTDGTALIPAAAESIEGNEDGTVWTAKLREGMKWSDGAPFTADDFTWQYDRILDDRLGVVKPHYIKLGGELGEVRKVDDFTVEFRFKGNNVVFGEMLAFSEGDCGRGGRHMYIPFSPSHYLSQFTPDTNSDAEKLASDLGFDNWEKMYHRMDWPIGNPDRPSTRPYVLTSGRTGKRVEGIRNPYFYAVDPAGNQLPYIDKYVWDPVDKTVLQLKVLAGEIDFQGRKIDFSAFPTLKAGEDKGGYKIFLWPSSFLCDLGLMMNLAYDGPYAEAFNQTKFRNALSHAIDRERMNTILFHGVGTAKGAMPLKGHAFYPGDEIRDMWMEFDPDLANQMLDEIVPNKDAQGFRLMANGERLKLEILASNRALGAAVDIAEMVALNWSEVGIFTEMEQTKLLHQRLVENTVTVWVTHCDSSGFLFTNPKRYMPQDGAGSKVWAIWYDSKGANGTEPPDDVKALYDLWDEGKVSPEGRRIEIAKQIYTRAATESILIGLIGQSPMTEGTVIVNNKLRNVPPIAVNAAPYRTPSTAFPEQFWWAD